MAFVIASTDVLAIPPIAGAICRHSGPVTGLPAYGGCAVLLAVILSVAARESNVSFGRVKI